jgi:cell division protein FtsZ
MEESAAAVEAIRQTCAGRVSVIIVAGLGGSTGTGMAPVVARIAQRQGCKNGGGCAKPMPWEGRDALVYALVAIKTLACIDRLVTVPLGELLEGRASPGEVLRAGHAMVAASVERLMTSEGWLSAASSRSRALRTNPSRVDCLT